MKSFLSFFTSLICCFGFVAPGVIHAQFQTERLSNAPQSLLIQGDVLWEITTGQLNKRNALTGEMLHSYRNPVDEKDGFFSGALAPDGALWLALGRDGVARFNGVDQWQVWNHLNTPVLPGNIAFRNIGVDAAGGVWVDVYDGTQASAQTYHFQGSSWTLDPALSEITINAFVRGPQGEFIASGYDTLLLRNNNSWVPIPEPEESPYNYPENPTFDQEGRLWVTASFQKFYRYNSLDAAPDLITAASDQVYNMVFKSDGTLYAATYEKGVGRWDGNAWQYLPSVAGSTTSSFTWRLALNGAGELWVGQILDYYVNCLTRFEGTTAVENRYSGVAEAFIMGTDGAGNAWFGGYGHVFTRQNLNDGSLDYFELFDYGQNEFNPYETKIFPGVGNEVWMRTYNGKLLHFDGNAWSTFFTPATNEIVSDFVCTGDGKLFMAYQNYGPSTPVDELRFYDPLTATWDHVDFSIFGQTPNITSLAADGLNNLWFYSDLGVGKRSPDGSIEIFPTSNSGTWGFFGTGELQANANGDIILLENTDFSLPGDLYRIGLNGDITPISWPNGFPAVNINSIDFNWHLDNVGRIWVLNNNPLNLVTINGWMYDSGFWTDITPEMSNSGKSISSDGYGTVYFGGYSFLTRFKTAGRIEGTLYRDQDYDCTLTPSDTPLPGFLLVAEDGDHQYFGLSHADGTYRIYSGSNNVTANAVPPNALWQSCTPVGIPLTITSPDVPAIADFELRPVVDCPLMQVSISTPFLRRCFSNTYTAQACNTGTTTATNAYVEISLPAEMSFITSSFPATLLDPQHFSIVLGDMPSGVCKTFTFNVLVSCDDTQIGQTLCVEANVFPDTLCDPNTSAWNGADLRVTGVCTGDSVRFDLQNVGSTALSQSIGYQLIRNETKTETGFLSLGPGESQTFYLPATGDSWRLISDQEPTRPFADKRPSLAVEGCRTGNQSYSKGFVDAFPNSNGSAFGTRDCHEIRGAVDPNDKSAQPRGVGEQTHFILPRNEINYQIRFQNTGTDTAFTVVIRDTLDAGLDYATFKPGVGSQPYRIELTGNVISFIFENILLPDSNINEAASHGFVQFSLRPRADLALGSAIFNRAGIYFDFNEPVITNTVWHIVDSTLEHVVGTEMEPLAATKKLLVFPNPAQAYFWVKAPTEQPGHLRVFDQQGRLMTQIEMTQGLQQIDCGNWANGLYVLCLRDATGRVSYGKLLLRH